MAQYFPTPVPIIQPELAEGVENFVSGATVMYDLLGITYWIGVALVIGLLSLLVYGFFWGIRGIKDNAALEEAYDSEVESAIDRGL